MSFLRFTAKFFLLSLLIPGATLSTLGQSLITNVNTDKARYYPNDTITIYTDLTNSTGGDVNGATATLVVSQLGNTTATFNQSVNLAAGASSTLFWNWRAPGFDYQGFLLTVTIQDANGNQIDRSSGAIDVSSDWTRFPRYGFLSSYPSQDGVLSEHQVWNLKNFHINALQYYDWENRAHVPLAGSPQNPAANWTDIGNRSTSRDTVNTFLNATHSFNMYAFNYNAANSAWANYASDGSGVDPAWGIYTNASCTNQDNFALDPNLFATPQLDLFDPNNVGWQQYIANRENDVYAAYAFDGWHIDQLVNAQNPYTCGGVQFNIYPALANFVGAERNLTGHRVVFNSSGNTALAEVSSQGIDVLYDEWLFPGHSYFDLTLDNQQAKGLGHALVTAIYINRYAGAGFFNTPGVLFTDASLFASGGSHIELGDGYTTGLGVQALSTEYFPDHSRQVSGDLYRTLRTYYDFQVGYENILRDNVSSLQGGIINIQNAGGTPLTVTLNASTGSLWGIRRATPSYETLSLINLLNANSNDAPDAFADRPAPNRQDGLTVTYYYSRSAVNRVQWASPDFNAGAGTDIPFNTGSDGNGNFVRFTLPSLLYWDLIFFS